MSARYRPGPNDVMPCGTDSARRTHLAHGQLCPVCEPDPTVRRAMCPGCGERVPVVGSEIAGHATRIVRQGRPVATAQECTGTGHPVAPLSPITDALRERRHELGLTQAQVADKSRLPRSVIASLETGVSPLRMPGLLAVADALGCELVAVPRETTP